MLAISITLACATPSQAQDAALLKASHISLRASLASSPFQRPLLLHSTDNPGGLQGDVYAEIVKAQSDYLQIAFDADQGSMGTAGCRILLEAVALGTERHATQPHEMERVEYLALKRGQARMQGTPG